MSKPWQKVIEGKKKFQEVIQNHPSTATKQSLMNDLIAAVSDRKQYPVQEAMRIQCDYFYPENHLEKLSSMFVEKSDIGYGTRTHSVVLVDGTGQVDFYERTMKDPLNNKDWVETHFTFQIE
ncbi:transport and Golgi organization protein 2-like [Limulus polyphemus]|uniref:Transport and Golgi organization protein 2-like n=1 Tax=Limulus polyphemus TaxID=6850 RepID=A0ABM1BVP5_LIMPO|nr:transport and Golgi organization protein 2-like [Limulus polyphemus]